MQPSDARGPAATTDFLVISGGIIGLCLALNLKRHYRDCTVTLIEKEKSCGRAMSTPGENRQNDGGARHDSTGGVAVGEGA